MTVKLKKEWVDKIRPALVKALTGAQTRHGMFLDRGSMPVEMIIADVFIPEKSPTKDALERFIGEFPLTDFVSDSIARELYDLDDYKTEDGLIPLTHINGFESPEDTADRLLASLQSLPWQYTLSLPLPPELGDGFPQSFSRLDIGPNLKLVRGSADLEEHLPLCTGDPAALRRIAPQGILGAILPKPTWDEATIYIVARAEGFIGPYGGSHPHRQVVANIKSLLGLMIAVRAVKVNPATYGASIAPTFYVHKAGKDGFLPDNKLDFPESSSAILRRLIPFDNDGKMTQQETKQQWFLARLREIGSIFACGDHGDRLTLAGQWFFESQGHDDPLLAYVRTMVVLDILLGSQKGAPEMSIGDTIANRCAFLIGNDFTHREEILRDFKKIYAVRSQIVHRGKSELRLEEQTMLRKLQWMVRRVIQEEVTKIPAQKTT